MVMFMMAAIPAFCIVSWVIKEISWKCLLLMDLRQIHVITRPSGVTYTLKWTPLSRQKIENLR